MATALQLAGFLQGVTEETPRYNPFSYLPSNFSTLGKEFQDHRSFQINALRTGKIGTKTRTAEQTVQGKESLVLNFHGTINECVHATELAPC